MATAIIDGIKTRYEVLGSGPPLLMYSPAGFNAAIETWRTQSVYAKIKLLDHLPAKYACIVFDRRECGQSGGRVETVTWAHFAAQGKGLLDHLGFARAHIAGGCMGVSCALAFAVAYPAATQSLVLYWPVGGAKYRISTQQRFTEHLTFVASEGLAGVVALVEKDGKTFGADPRGGPWASVIKSDPTFAAGYAKLDIERYKLAVTGTARALFDRDSVPGPAPEDLLRLDIPALIVPGRDAAHATSAARYLEECLPRAEYWDIPVPDQTDPAVPTRVLNFLAEAGAP
jgi:pimeloyl-ACP methyl ester carboxylesterase